VLELGVLGDSSIALSFRLTTTYTVLGANAALVSEPHKSYLMNSKQTRKVEARKVIDARADRRSPGGQR
jgi:hypothetical protein